MDNRRRLQIVSAANPSLRLRVAPPTPQPRLTVTTAAPQRLTLARGGQVFDRDPEAQTEAPKVIRQLPKLNFSQKLQDAVSANTESDKIRRVNQGQPEIHTAPNPVFNAVASTFRPLGQGIARLIPGGQADIKANEEAQRQTQKNQEVWTNLYRQGKISKERYSQMMQSISGEYAQQSRESQRIADTADRSQVIGSAAAVPLTIFAPGAGVARNVAFGAGFGGVNEYATKANPGIKDVAIGTGIGGVVGGGATLLAKGASSLYHQITPSKPVASSISKYLATESNPDSVAGVLSHALGIDKSELGDLAAKVAVSKSKRAVNKNVKSFLSDYVPGENALISANEDLSVNLAETQDPQTVLDALTNTHPNLSAKARESLAKKVAASKDPQAIKSLLDAADDVVAKTTPKPVITEVPKTSNATRTAAGVAETGATRTNPATGELLPSEYDSIAKQVAELQNIPTEVRTPTQVAQLEQAQAKLEQITSKELPKGETPAQPGVPAPETIQQIDAGLTGTGDIQKATAKAVNETPTAPVANDQAKVAQQVSDTATVRTSDGRSPQDLINQARAQEVEYIGAVRKAASENGGEVTDKAVANAVKVKLERIAQKIAEKNGRPPTDMLRSTIISNDPSGSVDNIVASLERDGYTVWVDPRTGLADLTNRYTDGTIGYKDVAIKFVKGEGDPIVKELQIITPNMAKAKSEWGGHKLYEQVRAKVGDWQQAEKDMLALYEKADQLDAKLLNSSSDISRPSNALPNANGAPDAVYPATSSPSNTTLTGSPSTTKNRGNLTDAESSISDPLSTPSILKNQTPVKNISDTTRPAGFAESLSQTATPEAVYSDLLEITTKPNPQTFAQASQEIAGNEQAVLNDILGKQKGTLNDVDNARALLLLDKYIAEDNIPMATRVAEKINSSATENARAVQILSAVEKTTPSGAFKEAQKIVAEAQEKGLLPKDYVIPPESLQAINEKAVALQSLQPGTRDYDLGVAVLLRDLKGLVPPQVGDKLNSVVNISLLLNLKTFTRNVIGNVAGAVAETASTAVATPIDMLARLRTGKRTTALPSIVERFGGFSEGLKYGIQETNLGVRIGTGGKYDINTPVFESRFGQWVEKALGHSLSDTDKAFATSQFRDTLNSLMKANKVTKPTQEMIDIASQEGLYATYQGDSFIAKSLQGAKGWLNKANIKGFGLGDVVVRYPKTPGNLVAVGMDYSPYGFVKGLVQFAKLNEGSTLAAQREAVRNLGRGITGSGLIAGGYYLAKNNIITAKKGTDKDLNALQRQQGQPPFSFNITALGRLLRGEDTKARQGDVISTYDWLQPNAIQLSMGANMALNKSKGATDLISTTLDQAATGLETIQEQPVLAQTGRFAKTAFTPADQGGGIPNAVIDAVTGVPSMFVPSVVNQTAASVDNTARTTYDPNPVRMGFNKVVGKIPGATKTLEPVIDTFGNEVKRNQSDNPLTRIFNSFVNPAFVTKIQRTPEGELVLDIYNRTGETQQIPRVAAKTQMVNTSGEKGSKAESYTLSGKQLTEFQKLTGSLAQKTFAELANNPSFMALSDSEKAKVMANKLSDINSYAKIKVLGNKPKTMTEGVKSLASNNIGTFVTKVPEGVSGIAKSYLEKTAYMDKDTYKKYLAGAPDDIAKNTAAELNKSKPKGLGDIPAYNGLSKRYAEFEKAKAQAKKDGSWSVLDEQKKTKEFWKGAAKDARDNLTKDIYDNGSKDIQSYINKGWIKKEDLDKAIQLDNELYAADLTENLKFSKKFRAKYGYGVPAKETETGDAKSSGGGKGGRKGGKGKSAATQRSYGFNELNFRFKVADVPEISALPSGATSKKLKFAVPSAVQVTPVRLKL